MSESNSVQILFLFSLLFPLVHLVDIGLAPHFCIPPHPAKIGTAAVGSLDDYGLIVFV